MTRRAVLLGARDSWAADWLEAVGRARAVYAIPSAYQGVTPASPRHGGIEAHGEERARLREIFE